MAGLVLNPFNSDLDRFCSGIAAVERPRLERERFGQWTVKPLTSCLNCLDLVFGKGDANLPTQQVDQCADSALVIKLFNFGEE